MVTIVREPQQDSFGWLVGMWVAPSERGTGAADALIDTALAWAEHEQIGVVRLLVTEDNDRAASVSVGTASARTAAAWCEAPTERPTS
jgi:GNAT superfamily N-acetyltransferase